MAADKYVIPSHLDDPELIGLWTLICPHRVDRLVC